MIYVYCRIGLFSSLISHGGVVRSVVPHLNVFLPMFDESYNNRGYNKTDKTGNNRVKNIMKKCRDFNPDKVILIS